MKLLKRKPLNKYPVNRTAPAFIIVGLGNPGAAYSETRHNTGFRVIDLLTEAAGGKLKKAFFRPFLFSETMRGENRLILVKPLTFMNRSGIVFPSLPAKWTGQERRIVVICDNMDLNPGEIRIKQKGSSAGHNGIKSILEYLDTGEFLRIFIGVGRPSENTSVVEHVLGIPDEEERRAVALAEERAVSAVLSLMESPLSRVMNEFNRKQT